MKSYIPAYLKKQNRTTVLNLFLEHKELTRADISKLTGISLPTVIKIVDFLQTKQILLGETEASTLSDSGLGRKSQGDELYSELEKGLENLRTPAFLRPETRIMPAISEYAGIVGASAIAFTNCLPGLLEENI